jgi:2',5'-phosphodiesterase
MILFSGYHADVICLQEVDRKVFENDLLPSLDLLGYSGSLKVKGHGQQGCEGVAMFIHRDKFR